MSDSGRATERYLEALKTIITASAYDESAWRVIETAPLHSAQGFGGRLRLGLKNAVVRAFARRGIVLCKARRFSAEARELGRDWPMIGFTMTGKKRLDNTRLAVETVLRENVPGDLMETGVWRGGSVMFMKALLDLHGDRTRTVWCADSFEGLPPPVDDADGDDLSELGYVKVSLEAVKGNFARLGLLDERVKFLKGWFSDTLPTAPVERIALLRLDGDLYSSTMDALTNLYHKVSPGGFVIVDDYQQWPACKRAVDEFRATQGITEPLHFVDQDAVYWRRATI
ncbi:MAG: TylF/MycF family methyltransferase [Acetobacteraceae bacterium]|nr:TylF/MycF family methyltransferase [Acetobacteraceae bacterium]